MKIVCKEVEFNGTIEEWEYVVKNQVDIDRTLSRFLGTTPTIMEDDAHIVKRKKSFWDIFRE